MEAVFNVFKEGGISPKREIFALKGFHETLDKGVVMKISQA